MSRSCYEVVALTAEGSETILIQDYICSLLSALCARKKARYQAPPERRGSGNIMPIPRASLTSIAFWRENFQLLTTFRKHNLWFATPECLCYFSMTQHFLGVVISSFTTMDTVNYKLLTKPEESVSVTRPSSFGWSLRARLGRGEVRGRGEVEREKPAFRKHKSW